MKFSILSLGLLAVLTPLTCAWSKEDQEIFRVRDELVAHEGPKVSFYDLLEITSSASQDDINKAYRKKTKALHPDKVKQQLSAERAAKAKAKQGKGVTVTKPPSQSEIRAAVKAAGEKQARLGLVAGILRGPGRERYDHFMSHGFPTWKGTGYYYSRYRPGLGTALLGAFLVGGGGFHYVALYMAWKRQREFVDRYIKFARHAAWGDNLTIPGVDDTPAPPPPAPAGDEDPLPPQAVNRKQRRMQEREAKKETAKETKRQGGRRALRSNNSGTAAPVPQTQPSSTDGPQGAKKRVVAENGKVLVVDSLGDVYLEQLDADGKMQEFLLDPNEMPQPTALDTAIFQIPLWAYRRVFGKKIVEDELDDGEVDAEEEESEDAPLRTPSTDSAEDFEMLDPTKSVEDLARKATGAQSAAKAKKRNTKKK